MIVNLSNILKRVDSSLEVNDEMFLPLINYNNEDIPLKTPLKVEAIIMNRGEYLTVEGKLKCVLNLKCSRCLETFEYNLECDFEERISSKEEEVDFIYFEGDSIDLTDIIVNNILLNLPMKVVCKEECKGLCHQCGSNMNVNQCDCSDNTTDPRLAVLKKLLKDS
ncbi:hypothetical protein OXPF_21170 [Oxobacter pfennigii]|uniref:Large ribosomal RNA subunit accumulation protein YceD n=1 Tax=Oxobacter pfennigii TaxID=36849 RepID=A0A0N8NT63_9CLOT|nr:DUF177 domain-containing protein [Oxobacter pfennigii]KPU43952.1 hypothetical protein OXPF_21170 [Oxobacter pfennigii]